MLWLSVLLVGCLAVNKDYYSGKVVQLKENNFRRALLDFEYVVMVFDSKNCNVSRMCTGEFRNYVEKGAATVQNIIELNRLEVSVQFCRLAY